MKYFFFVFPLDLQNDKPIVNDLEKTKDYLDVMISPLPISFIFLKDSNSKSTPE
jgi:hypothetical protein